MLPLPRVLFDFFCICFVLAFGERVSKDGRCWCFWKIQKKSSRYKLLEISLLESGSLHGLLNLAIIPAKMFNLFEHVHA